MKSLNFKRARKPEQKERRHAVILKAAADIFDERGLEHATLSRIACAAGLSKAGVYRYFESREEIFLELLSQAFVLWVEAVEAKLSELGPQPSLAADSGAGSLDAKLQAVAKAIAGSLATRPRLGALGAATASILERNVSEEVIVEFKSRLLPLFVRLGNALHAALPELQVAQARQVLLYLHAAQNGLWPACHPPAAVAEALLRPDLSVFALDWARDLEALVLMLLRGQLASPPPASQTR